MGCNCGRKRMEAVTSVNVPGGSMPDRPDIAAAKVAAAQAKVEAARAMTASGQTNDAA